MGRASIARRDVVTLAQARAARLEALGLLDQHLSEAIEVHLDAMRNAVLPRGGIDYPARQRSATALLELGLGLGSTSQARDGGGNAPLLSLTVVQAPQHEAVQVIEVLPEQPVK